jgi:cation diffusion facilitator family transporter
VAPTDNYRQALGAILYAMCFNFLIAGGKLVVAVFLTPSAALFAEGLHSLADAFNSFTLLFGLIQGKRPPDRSHPFGYGLETNFWALMASFVLFFSALASIYIGWSHLHHPPEPLKNPFWGVLLLVLSVVFEIGALSAAANAVLQELGEKTHPLNLIPKALGLVRHTKSPTTRFVFFEDLIALLGALIALLAISLSQWAVQMQWLSAASGHWPDAIASIVIGCMLLVLSINLFSYNRNFLTVSAAPQSTEQQIEALVLSTHGVSAILDLKTIDQGLNGLYIQVKVEVDPDIPIREVDDMIEHLKSRLQQNLPQVRDVFVEVVADESEETWGDALQRLIDEGLEQEVLNPQEATLMANVLEFTDSVLRDVMIPRTDVVMVEVETPLLDVADLFIERRHSKLPVYEEQVDRLLGVVHERSVLQALRQGGAAPSSLKDLLVDIPIYPETKPLTALLEDFKRQRFQMAAVVDEHGGFAGLVTVADLLEELVGDLWEDNQTQEEPELIALSPTQWQVVGRYPIEDLNQDLDLNIPNDDYMTLAGFVFGLLGREPMLGDEVHFESLRLVVSELDGLRIKTLTLHSQVPLSKQAS